jgi:hypothetical protein
VFVTVPDAAAVAAAVIQDHTCYKFEAVTAEDLPAIQPLGTASRKKRKSSGQSEQQSAAAGPAAGTCALPSSSQGGVAAESSRYRRLSKDMVS